jgi:hypothetical protein
MRYKIIKRDNLFDLENSKSVIIPVGADNIVNSFWFKEALKKQPLLLDRFNSILSTTSIQAGKSYILVVEAVNYILMTIKEIDKYSATVLNILNAYSDLKGKLEEYHISEFTIPVFNYGITKLMDSICIAISMDYLSIFDIPIQIIDISDNLQYYLANVSKEHEMFSWKSDSAKFNKFILDDDFVLIASLNRALLTKDITISKAKLVKIYELCKVHFDMFRDIEFYKTDYGKFFKEFNQKFFFIINNGILRQRGKSGINIGPGMSYYLLANSSKVIKFNKKINEITDLIGKSIKDKPNKYDNKFSQKQDPPQTHEPLF